MSEWLDNLKVGDKVTVVPGGLMAQGRIVGGEITGETKTLWRVAFGRDGQYVGSYLKRSGKVSGSSSSDFYSGRIDPYDDEAIRVAVEERRRSRLARKLEDYPWRKLTGDELRQVQEFVKGLVDTREERKADAAGKEGGS